MRAWVRGEGGGQACAPCVTQSVWWWCGTCWARLVCVSGFLAGGRPARAARARQHSRTAVPGPPAARPAWRLPLPRQSSRPPCLQVRGCGGQRGDAAWAGGGAAWLALARPAPCGHWAPPNPLAGPSGREWPSYAVPRAGGTCAPSSPPLPPRRRPHHPGRTARHGVPHPWGQPSRSAGCAAAPGGAGAWGCGARVSRRAGRPATDAQKAVAAAAAVKQAVPVQHPLDNAKLPGCGQPV